MNKSKATLIFANIILGLVIYLSLGTDKTRPINLSSQLINILHDIDTIEITEGKNKRLILNKKVSGWVINQPINWEAENLIVSNLKTKLAHSNPYFVISNDDLLKRGEVLSDYGVDTNSTSIILKSGERFLNIRIGKATRDENFIFVQVVTSDDLKNSVWKVSLDLKESITASPIYWAKKTFIDIPLYGLDEIQIDIANLNFSEKTRTVRKDGRWSFKEPFSSIADQESLTFDINRMISTQVIEFIEIKSEGNLTEICELTLKGLGKKETFNFFNSQEGVIICKKQQNSSYFLINLNFLELVSNWGFKHRDRKIFKKEQRNITKISYKTDLKDMEIKLTEDKFWSVTESNFTNFETYKGDSILVEKLVNALHEVEVVNYIYPPNTTEGTDGFFGKHNNYFISVTFEDGNKSSIEIADFAKSNNIFRAHIQNENVFCKIKLPKDIIFIDNKFYYKNKSIINKSEYTDIIVKKFDSNQSFTLNSNTDNADYNSITEINVTKFLDESFNETGIWNIGDWNPWRYTIELSTKDNNKSMVIFLSDSLGKEYRLGAILNSGIAFELNNDQLNLNNIFRDQNQSSVP